MRIFALLALLITLTCCNQKKLSVYGNKTAIVKTVDGKPVVDSIDFTIPDFAFINQDSQLVNNSTIGNRVYVADFFFTTCPSICPKMKKEMLRIYEKYKTNDDVLLLSYTIDPARDTVGKLKTYSRKLGIENGSKWQFLTGNKDSIYSLAESFLVSAAEDPDAPGGHVHSGNFILVDKQKRIRGYYDGTSAQSVDLLLADIDLLLQEK